jgi:tetratricopeptide (TPR) repeat protein
MENTPNPYQTLLEEAIELENNSRTGEAIELYRKIISLSPSWSSPYYNLGLIYKYQCDWRESFYYNQKAIEADVSNEAAYWNLGIAATALNDWKTARHAWNYFNLKLDVNDDELNMNLGSTPVRLSTNSEVIWARRIDPARTIIESVPLPESKRRFNDLLLNDGAPVGYRISNGTEYPVFNELQVLTESNYKTFSVVAETDDQDKIYQLGYLCDREGIGFEDWTTVRILCKQCSEGIPHEQHDHDNKASADGIRTFGFAARDRNTVEEILKQWRVLTDTNYSDIVLELG